MEKCVLIKEILFSKSTFVKTDAIIAIHLISKHIRKQLIFRL